MTKVIRPIWTVDAETDPFKRKRIPKPFIWGVYTGSEYYEFIETEDLITFLMDKNVIAYAHNGGKFDWHFITQYIPDFSPLTIIAGRLAKFKIGECEFRDSYNIIPAPLSAYKKDEIDYAIFEEGVRDEPENWENIRSYLKSDCIYLHEMISSFIEDYGVNLTQASAAMKVWSKNSGIPKPKSSPYYYEEMSQYYYGGRVECFQTGIISYPFKVVDINSAYPFAMLSDHPWGIIYSSLDYIPPEFSDDEIGRCFITLNAASMGAFPIREKTGLQFPDDGEVRKFYITGWEYLAARDTNTLANENIIEVRIFDDKINFKDYVEHFYEMKTQAKSAKDDARYLFAKLFLNSLYGKFSSNPANYEEFMTIPAQHINASNEDGWFFCKMIDEMTAVVNRPLEEEKRRYYDVSVAASITGFVRGYLWRNIKSCDNVIYCDTDSIAAKNTDNILISDNLGAWSIDATCDKGYIAGKKLYAFHKVEGGYKIASKGVKLTPEEIIEIASGKEIVYEPEVPTFSIKGPIRFTPRRIKMTEK